MFSRRFVIAVLVMYGLCVAAALALPQSLLYPIQWTGGNQYESSQFGMRTSPQGGGGTEYHWGLDIACREGTPVLASAAGTVIICAKGDAVFGNYMIIETPEYTLLYGHLSETWVPRGQKVTRGQTIGLSGNTGQSTGPHLHYSVMVNPKFVLLSQDRRTK